MKKKYMKPFFTLEAFDFTSSIAKCGVSINEPLVITLRDNVCSNGEDGHIFGGQNGKKGEIVNRDPDVQTVTLFNDGIDSYACEYDWAGPGTNIAQTGVSFAESFYGNESNPNNHAPGYKGQAFLS